MDDRTVQPLTDGSDNIEQGSLLGPPVRVSVEFPSGPITEQERRKRQDEYNYQRRKKWEQSLRDRTAAMFAKKVHPITGASLANNGETCGSCAWSFKHGRYWKCEYNATHGPKTDLRKKWPACSWWAFSRDAATGMSVEDLIGKIDEVTSMKVVTNFNTGICTIELEALEAADILMDKDTPTAASAGAGAPSCRITGAESSATSSTSGFMRRPRNVFGIAGF